MILVMHSITFSNSDSEDIDFPHNDALIITLWMDEYKINRVLVDPRFGIELMFLVII